MLIDKKTFMERYYVPDEWYDKDVYIRDDAPEEMKQKEYAYLYLYGEVPYEGYVFPYDDEGIRSSYITGKKK